MAAFNPSLHPRAAAGSAGGGQFTARGSAPAPSKKPGRNGSRYTRTQFAQLRSLSGQHAAGARLTARQAHALHVAHELHLAHEKAASKAKAAPKKPAAKRTARKR